MMTALSSPSGSAKPSRRHLARAGNPSLALRACVPAAVLLAVVLVSGCGQAPAAQKAKTIEVEFTTPITGTVIDYQDFTGRLDAVKTIEIRSRVSGYVTEVPFKEGDVVHEGDLLFQIDPRPYQADLDQQEANLKLAEADRNLQEKNVARARRLMGINSLSREDYDTAVATWEKSVAAVGAAQAARDKSKLNLIYARVIWEKEQAATATSGVPHIVSGRISRRYVDPGNLVLADNTLLTTIVTEDPVYAYFDVDERTYLDLLATLAPPTADGSAGASPSQYGSPAQRTTASQSTLAHAAALRLPVMIRLANEDDFSQAGTVNFVDNRVNASMGTVRMRGIFANSTGRLKAGLFARIRLPTGHPYQATIVPDEAVQSDQGRKYVYVVNSENKVVYRPVQLGQAIGDLRVIRPPEKGQEGKEGLSEGERVIITGMQRVRPNVEVKANKKDPPKPPESPLVKLLKTDHPERDNHETHEQHEKRQK
jgi:RND family efflux transporter MFP subunit